MPTSRIQIPCAKPVPSALTIASFAAKRMARNRTGLLYPRKPASSSGISSRRTKCSPCRSYTACTRSSWTTSVPMPKIIVCSGPEAAARFQHQCAHVVDRPGQAVEQRARHDRMADVQFDDFRDGGHGLHVVVVEPVAGMHRQSYLGAEARRFDQ